MQPATVCPSHLARGLTPTVAADSASGAWPSSHYITAYENTSLLIGADPYPWRNASVTHDLGVEAWELSDVTSAFGPRGQNRQRASTCVSQFFDYGAYKPLSFGWSEPPAAVKRAMTWLELVMGCGGVLQYCWKCVHAQLPLPPSAHG